MHRILIVDDEVIITSQLEALLTSVGYSVVGVAFSSEEAVPMARETKPDLILMDIFMDGMSSGINAAQKIKDELNIPIIFISGYSEEELVSKAKQVEPLGYLLKPFQANQVTTSIEVALHKFKIDREFKEAHDSLEKQFLERNEELTKANEAIKERQQELEIRTLELEETNAALKILIELREAGKRELEEKVLANVKTLIDPYLRKLRENDLSPTQNIYLDPYLRKLREKDLSPTQNIYLQILESNLADITAPFLRNLAMKYTGLTPKEVQVAVLVKDGKNTKQIAQIIDTTVRAVEFHRHSLRDKLNLRNKKANLRTFLMALP